MGVRSAIATGVVFTIGVVIQGGSAVTVDIVTGRPVAHTTGATPAHWFYVRHRGGQARHWHQDHDCGLFKIRRP